MLFLDKESLKELTGYRHPAKQVAWLKRAGIKFTVNRYNHPLVLQKHLEEILCNSPSKPSRRIEPDLEGLHKAMGLH